MKQNVPENVRQAAREMGEKAFRERLREINMSQHEHSLYTKYLELVKKPIQQMIMKVDQADVFDLKRLCKGK